MVLDQERTAANKQEGREKERAGEKLYKKNWKPKWSKPTKGGFVCKKSWSESKRFFLKTINIACHIFRVCSYMYCTVHSTVNGIIITKNLQGEKGNKLSEALCNFYPRVVLTSLFLCVLF